MSASANDTNFVLESSPFAPQDARGLGIATVLKARCIRWAREHGVVRLATSKGNPAMLRVNEKLGFRRTFVEMRLVNRLG